MVTGWQTDRPNRPTDCSPVCVLVIVVVCHIHSFIHLFCKKQLTECNCTIKLNNWLKYYTVVPPVCVLVTVVVRVYLCVQWMQLRNRKQNLVRLFEQMQHYQFETQMSADVDQPLDSRVRALTDDDVDRYLSLSLSLSLFHCLSVCC